MSLDSKDVAHHVQIDVEASSTRKNINNGPSNMQIKRQAAGEKNTVSSTTAQYVEKLLGRQTNLLNEVMKNKNQLLMGGEAAEI